LLRSSRPACTRANGHSRRIGAPGPVCFDSRVIEASPPRGPYHREENIFLLHGRHPSARSLFARVFECALPLHPLRHPPLSLRHSPPLRQGGGGFLNVARTFLVSQSSRTCPRGCALDPRSLRLAPSSLRNVPKRWSPLDLSEARFNLQSAAAPLGWCNYVELIDTIFTDVEGVD